MRPFRERMISEERHGLDDRQAKTAPKRRALRQDKALMAAHWAYELSIKDKIMAAGSLRQR